MFKILLVLVFVLFVLSLPVLMARACNAKRTVMLVSMLMSAASMVCLVPFIISSMGVAFPAFFINFISDNIGTWLFFINLFIVVWFNRKKLSE